MAGFPEKIAPAKASMWNARIFKVFSPWRRSSGIRISREPLLKLQRSLLKAQQSLLKREQSLPKLQQPVLKTQRSSLKRE
jgi:hypothetical protein